MSRRAGTRRAPAWLPRAVLVGVLLVVAVVPLAGSVAGPQVAACQGTACRQVTNPQRWAIPLTGAWAVGRGLAGTFPVSGQAYVAADDGVAVLADGLAVSAYQLANGAALWQITLGGFKPGSTVMSVRAWPGVVTVGVTNPAGTARTEVVIDSVTGVPLRRYPAALFGGAVAASAAATTVIGTSSVTRYDNGTGKVRWRRQADARQAWRADGAALYLTESSGGYLHGAAVTGLRVIDLDSGTERTLTSPFADPFTGSLAEVASNVVIFTSADGVIAYSGITGGMLWSMRGVVPEGTDPAEGLAYFTSASGALLGVDPATGKVRRSVSGSTAPGGGGMYVVRGGVALGLDSGANGDAWGYSLAAGRVTWTAPGLPWPHYFADVSGIGGSAAWSGDIVVITACQHLAPAPTTPPSPTVTATPTPTVTPASTASGGHVAARVASSAPSVTSTGPSPSSTPSATPSATPSPPQICAAPVLVALTI